MQRRQFLRAAAVTWALPLPSEGETDTPAPAADGRRAPARFQGLHATVYAEGLLDEEPHVDVTAGESWDGQEWFGVVDLHVHYHLGQFAVTLDATEARRLGRTLLREAGAVEQ